MLMKSGVYQILNLLNGHSYIGSSRDIGHRWRIHISSLRNNKHHSIYLQRAFNTYGESAFLLKSLFYCDEKNLIFFEQRSLDILKPEYNMRTIAESSRGVKWSAATRTKREARRSEYAERMRKVGASGKGISKSKEHKEKIGASNLGKHAGDLGPSKLTWDIVKSIRAESNMTQREISEKYGIVPSHVNRILHNERWVKYD